MLKTEIRDLLRDDPLDSTGRFQVDLDFNHIGNRALDRSVAAVHALTRAIKYPHPYLLFMDIATLASGAMGMLLVWRNGLVSPLRMLMLWVVVTLGYQGFQWAKAKFSGEKSRHYVRDLTFYWVPAFLLVGALSGIPWRLTLDYLGLYLSLWCGLVRLGCFFGGCCYGKPCKSVGVLYQRWQLFESDHPRRKYRPGPFRAKRVFPLQLVSAAVNLTLFVVLWIRLASGAPDGQSFFIYMAFYAPYRFTSEYFRGDRERKRRLTRTQRLLIAHGILAVVALALGVV